MRTDHIFFVIFLTVSLFVMIINHLQNDDIFFRIEGQIMNRKKSYGSRKLISIEHKNPNHLNHVWGKKKKKGKVFCLVWIFLPFLVMFLFCTYIGCMSTVRVLIQVVEYHLSSCHLQNSDDANFVQLSGDYWDGLNYRISRTIG